MQTQEEPTKLCTGSGLNHGTLDFQTAMLPAAPPESQSL